MNHETSTRTAGRRSIRVGIGLIATGAVMVLGSLPAAAASGTQVITGSTSLPSPGNTVGTRTWDQFLAVRLKQHSGARDALTNHRE